MVAPRLKSTEPRKGFKNATAHVLEAGCKKATSCAMFCLYSRQRCDGCLWKVLPPSGLRGMQCDALWLAEFSEGEAEAG